jgi:D-ribose pyranose/furanose isomerase RbsD
MIRTARFSRTHVFRRQGRRPAGNVLPKLESVLPKLLCAVMFLAACAPAYGAPPEWRERLAAAMPLLGHRNWILVVDSAYPLQISPGVETIETNANQVEVVREVLHAIDESIQVRPVIFMDAEFSFVQDDEAPGVSAYRYQINAMLHDYKIESLPHEKIISNIDEAGRTFRVLVLKTNMTIPYTSVFFRLDCKYWSDDQEKDLRKRMGAAK